MANSVKKTLSTDVITKVATNVYVGVIHLIGDPSLYFYDYRQTGEAAPANLETAVQADRKTIEIESSTAIDIYMSCQEDSYVIVSV